MSENIKSKMSSIDWQDYSEVIELYESNLIYFDNFGNLTNKDSLLDILGPWPWYILSCELFALGMGYLFLLPIRQKKITNYYD